MNQAVIKHIPVKLEDGSRTSVSMSSTQYEVFVQRMGGDARAVRSILAEAARTAKPRLGVTRSQAVRLAMETMVCDFEATRAAVYVGADHDNLQLVGWTTAVPNVNVLRDSNGVQVRELILRTPSTKVEISR